MRLQRRWTAVLLAVLLSLILTACGGAPPDGAALQSPAVSPADSQPQPQQETFPGEDLPGEDLSGEDLSGEDFPEEDLSGEDFPEEDFPEETLPDGIAADEAEVPDIDGAYTTAEDVSLYLVTYGELPSNFITKKEARALGWPGGDLEPYAPGKCIGGDSFGNYEGLLPEDREYHECDIDTLGKKSRGAKRLVFSDDGLIYYTEDHYESFTLLYGEE